MDGRGEIRTVRQDPSRDACKDDSLFRQPWWLDAVAPGSWGEVKVVKDGVLAARLPYVIKKRFGMTALTMPKLTPYLGPWVRMSEGKYVNRLSREMELLSELIELLPTHDLFRQSFHYSISNWLPFYWRGFLLQMQYTYVIADLSDMEALRREAKDDVRRHVRIGAERLSVSCEPDIDLFLSINEKTFLRQKMARPYSKELVKRLDSACAAHGCRRMFFARDVQGRVHSAVYLVWDSQAAYVLMAGVDDSVGDRSAVAFLLWNAIEFAATVTQTFDFEGSMLRHVERLYRHFGARQKAYPFLLHESRRMQFIRAGQIMLKAVTGSI